MGRDRGSAMFSSERSDAQNIGSKHPSMYPQYEGSGERERKGTGTHATDSADSRTTTPTLHIARSREHAKPRLPLREPGDSEG